MPKTPRSACMGARVRALCVRSFNKTAVFIELLLYHSRDFWRIYDMLTSLPWFFKPFFYLLNRFSIYAASRTRHRYSCWVQCWNNAGISARQSSGLDFTVTTCRAVHRSIARPQVHQRECWRRSNEIWVADARYYRLRGHRHSR